MRSYEALNWIGIKPFAVQMNEPLWFSGSFNIIIGNRDYCYYDSSFITLTLQLNYKLEWKWNKEYKQEDENEIKLLSRNKGIIYAIMISPSWPPLAAVLKTQALNF